MVSQVNWHLGPRNTGIEIGRGIRCNPSAQGHPVPSRWARLGRVELPNIPVWLVGWLAQRSRQDKIAVNRSSCPGAMTHRLSSQDGHQRVVVSRAPGKGQLGPRGHSGPCMKKAPRNLRTSSACSTKPASVIPWLLGWPAWPLGQPHQRLQMKHGKKQSIYIVAFHHTCSTRHAKGD